MKKRLGILLCALTFSAQADNNVTPPSAAVNAYYAYVDQLIQLPYANAIKLMDTCNGQSVPGAENIYAQCDAVLAALPLIRSRERVEAIHWYNNTVTVFASMPSAVLFEKERACSSAPQFVTQPSYTECKAIEEAIYKSLSREDRQQTGSIMVVIPPKPFTPPPPPTQPTIERFVPITGTNILVPDRNSSKNLEIHDKK